MQEGMQYGLIKWQGLEPLEVYNLDIFNSYFIRLWQSELLTDHGFVNYGTNLNLILPDFG